MTLLETSAELESNVSSATGGDDAQACPFCRGALRPWLNLGGDWRRPSEVPEPIALAWCDACDYGSLEPRPSLDELAAHYDLDEYYTHRAPVTTAVARTFGEKLLEHLAWRADRGLMMEINPDYLARHGMSPPARLCDLGCGNGGLLRRFAAAGFEVAGVDTDAEACRAARFAGLDVVEGSAEHLPDSLVGERFDVVTMGHVLEHVLNPTAALANIAGMLRSGGRFIVETPNNASLGLREAGATWRWLDAPRHLNFFTPKSLAAICRRAGLEVEAIEYVGYVRQFLRDWIADEALIHTRLTALATSNSLAESTLLSPLPPRNSTRRAWRLLAKTWLAQPAAKYDSVRIIARKP